MDSADPRVDRRTARQRSGDAAEALALRALVARGLVPLARNVRCRAGEIDLVMRDGDAVVFVEVRRRRSEDFGGAAASVDAAKRRRLLRAARWWLLRRYGDGAWPACRFDVVAIGADPLRPRWLRAAFDGSGAC
jgi:putative endonuclease